MNEEQDIPDGFAEWDDSFDGTAQEYLDTYGWGFAVDEQQQQERGAA